MNNMHLQPTRIALLAVLAALLGVGVIWADTSRRGGAAARVATEPVAQSQALASSATASTGPGNLVADASPVATAEPVVATIARRGGVACAEPHSTVQVTRDLPVRAAPGGARISTLPASSVYLGSAMSVWVQEISANGRWGKVTVPWSKPVTRTGWIPLPGLQRGTVSTMVVADLSERRLRVYRGCREVLDVPAAIGRSQSPSPRGRFWVTDRVAVPAAQRGSFGSFAFGLSTIQPNTPPGWTGGNQMAIHGTGAPGSIGLAASAGCLRVGETTLDRLKSLVPAGTPVVIHA